MSQDDAPASVTADRPATEPVASRPDATAGGPPRGSARHPRPSRPPGRGGAVALALLLALVAVAAAGYVGWRQWQQRQSDASDARALSTLQGRLDNLAGTVDGLNSERGLLRQRLGDAAQVNRSLREEVLGQAERLRNLEDAVDNLSQKTLSGHDTLLLDETEALLRMGQQRYVLFHDAQGAATAYALAEQSLAQVDDGAFSGLRQSIEAEREALANSRTIGQAAALATLQRLRDRVAGLPLKSGAPVDAAQPQDAWSRVTSALSSVIRVQRDDDRMPLALTDARLTRELVALDLAQAEAALLAWDNAAAVDALERADAGLAAHFDDGDEAVRQARARIAAVRASLKPATPVHLGEALTELRNLRAVHALQPGRDGASAAGGKRSRGPARAASSGAQP